MTTTSSDTYSVQDLAQEVIRSFKEAGSDTARRLDLIRDPLRRFTSRPDVDELKMVKRFSPHTENSRYLYFDGQLSISYNHLPMGEVTPVHDHGNDRGYHLWEILVLYRGRLDHVNVSAPRRSLGCRPRRPRGRRQASSRAGRRHHRRTAGRGSRLPSRRRPDVLDHHRRRRFPTRARVLQSRTKTGGVLRPERVLLRQSHGIKR